MKHDISNASRDEALMTKHLDKLSTFVTEKRQEVFDWHEKLPETVKVSAHNIVPHTLLLEYVHDLLQIH
jgi:hypothetical protein